MRQRAAAGGDHRHHALRLQLAQFGRCDGVGIDDLGAERCQQIGDRTLAAADAAGQANDQAHGVAGFLQAIKWPSGNNSAIALRKGSS